jgi:PAS domain S-box-containing protein
MGPGLDLAWVHPEDRAAMRADLEQLRRDRRPRRRDVRAIRPDGSIRRIDSSVELGVDETGRAVEIVGVVRDVTEERAAVDQLASSERRLRDAERVGQIGSWEWDVVTNHTRWSDELYRIYGLAPQDVTLTHEEVLQRDHPDDRDLLAAIVAQAIRDRQPFECDHRIVRADGAIRLLHSRGQMVVDDSGRPARLIGVSQDVTDRRQEVAVQRRLAAIVEWSDDAIIGKALDGTIESWNRGAERLYGYAAAEAIGQSGNLLDDPEGVPEFPALMAGVARGERVDRLETVRRRKDGSVVHVSLTMSPIHDETGRIVGVSTIARDITERRRAEEEVRLAAERLRLASRATNDVIWDSDIAAGRVWWGEATEAVLGFRPSELPPGIESWTSLIHPDDRARVQAGQRKLVAEGGEFWSDEYRLRRADGSYAQMHDRGYVIRDAAGTPIRMVGSMMDVTARRQADERVRRSERQLARAQELARLGSFHRDLNSDTVVWSEQTYRIWGVDPATFTPGVAALLERVHPEDRATFTAALTRARTEGASFRIFYRIIRPDGEVRIVASEAEINRDSEGRPAEMFGFTEDLTGRRRVEAELVRSRAQLRELAARIEATREEERTHISRRIHEELGQALTALKLDITALATKLPPRARALRRRAREMAETLDRTLATTQTIALELRPGILDVLGLQAAVRWAVDDFGRRTGIQCRAAVTRSPVLLDDAVTTTVFRILEESLTNVARHAAASAVSVTLTLEPEALTLTVWDDGVGITPAAVWGPRSLGLLGVRERARGVGGDVTIDGAPGQGTTLTLRVPLPARPTGGLV